jgi:hypothetical protein
MTLNKAIGEFLLAKSNAYHTHMVCEHRETAYGHDVWSEGHPSDRQKLHERRMARLELRVARAAVRDVLAGDGLSLIDQIIEDQEIALECKILDDPLIRENASAAGTSETPRD